MYVIYVIYVMFVMFVMFVMYDPIKPPYLQLLNMDRELVSIPGNRDPGLGIGVGAIYCALLE